ncbi:MAG TPA: tetratricopeptide repeat protein [Burkholderiales bacterium]|jgi:tetratricopeptide (TPR) repeat protein|nr:tetratricopeptide repeat protein [Burkholderiales bacterium]
MSLPQGEKLFRWLVALALTALAGTVFAQSVVDRAKALLREGKAREAYELLEPASGELNDAESSYLLGIAALDSGKSGLAVIAFERALAYDPTFAPARAELVRALIANGETDQARVELARLNPDQVPPQVREKLAALQRALAEAADVAQRRRSGITAYIQGEAGYDSNINTGANASTISIPLFGGATATLAQVFTKKGSTFAGLGAGGIAFHEVRPGLRVFAGLDAKSRYNFEKLGDNHFEMNTASANAGARWQSGPHSASGAVTYLENNIGGQLLDQQLGVYGQYTYQVNPNDEAGLFAQWLDQKHPVSRALDTRLKLLGAGWRHGFEGAGTPVLSLAAYYGNDQAQGTDPSVGRRLVGGRIGYERTLQIGPRLLSGIARQWSWYGGENIFFLTTRNDIRTDAYVGLAFTPAKDWTVTPQYVLTRNESNIPVVDFTRHQFLVTVRKDFY